MLYGQQCDFHQFGGKKAVMSGPISLVWADRLGMMYGWY